MKKIKDRDNGILLNHQDLRVIIDVKYLANDGVDFIGQYWIKSEKTTSNV